MKVYFLVFQLLSQLIQVGLLASQGIVFQDHFYQNTMVIENEEITINTLDQAQAIQAVILEGISTVHLWGPTYVQLSWIWADTISGPIVTLLRTWADNTKNTTQWRKLIMKMQWRV